jgi:hypothetical protein
MVGDHPTNGDTALGSAEGAGETPVVPKAPARPGHSVTVPAHVHQPQRHLPVRTAIGSQQAHAGDAGLRVECRDGALVSEHFTLPVVPVRRHLRGAPLLGGHHLTTRRRDHFEHEGGRSGSDAPDAGSPGVMGIVRQGFGGPLCRCVTEKPSELFCNWCFAPSPSTCPTPRYSPANPDLPGGRKKSNQPKQKILGALTHRAGRVEAVWGVPSMCVL